MDIELERIAKEYVVKAEETFDFILSLSNVPNRNEMVACITLRQSTDFTIDGNNYTIVPHGRGCFFSDGKNEIDWSFGDTRICGVDCWHLKSYIDFYYPKLSSEFSFEKITLQFETAYENKKVEKRHDLFYFID